ADDPLAGPGDGRELRVEGAGGQRPVCEVVVLRVGAEAAVHVLALVAVAAADRVPDELDAALGGGGWRQELALAEDDAPERGLPEVRLRAPVDLHQVLARGEVRGDRVGAAAGDQRGAHDSIDDDRVLLAAAE